MRLVKLPTGAKRFRPLSVLNTLNLTGRCANLLTKIHIKLESNHSSQVPPPRQCY